MLFTNAATLPLLIGGWLSGVAYALTALVLSCVALAVLGQRWSRSMHGLRATLQQFGSQREGDAASANRHTGLERLRHGFESAHRRALRRVHRLKAARDTAEHDASAQRDLVARFTLAQRIARLGSWQWDRESDAISCSTRSTASSASTPARSIPVPNRWMRCCMPRIAAPSGAG